MYQQNTIERLKQMRLNGMAQVHHTALQDGLYQDHSRDEYLALLVDQEWEYRYQRKMDNLIRQARFRYPASLPDVDYTTPRGLDKSYFERLASLDFLAKKQHLIICGPTGVGKSYLAQVIGHQACMHLHRTLYFTTARLLDEAKIARVQGTYHKLLLRLEKSKLLILEDFGLVPFDADARRTLLDVVECKYERSSIVLTSQVPVKQWHQLIGEGTIADAILDRIVHAAHRIDLTGASMRKLKEKNN